MEAYEPAKAICNARGDRNIYIEAVKLGNLHVVVRITLTAIIHNGYVAAICIGNSMHIHVQVKLR